MLSPSQIDSAIRAHAAKLSKGSFGLQNEQGDEKCLFPFFTLGWVRRESDLDGLVHNDYDGESELTWLTSSFIAWTVSPSCCTPCLERGSVDFSCSACLRDRQGCRTWVSTWWSPRRPISLPTRCASERSTDALFPVPHNPQPGPCCAAIRTCSWLRSLRTTCAPSLPMTSASTSPNTTDSPCELVVSVLLASVLVLTSCVARDRAAPGVWR